VGGGFWESATFSSKPGKMSDATTPSASDAFVKGMEEGDHSDLLSTVFGTSVTAGAGRNDVKNKPAAEESGGEQSSFSGMLQEMPEIASQVSEKGKKDGEENEGQPFLWDTFDAIAAAVDETREEMKNSEDRNLFGNIGGEDVTFKTNAGPSGNVKPTAKPAAEKGTGESAAAVDTAKPGAEQGTGESAAAGETAEENEEDGGLFGKMSGMGAGLMSDMKDAAGSMKDAAGKVSGGNEEEAVEEVPKAKSPPVPEILDGFEKLPMFGGIVTFANSMGGGSENSTTEEGASAEHKTAREAELEKQVAQLAKDVEELKKAGLQEAP